MKSGTSSGAWGISRAIVLGLLPDRDEELAVALRQALDERGDLVPVLPGDAPLEAPGRDGAQEPGRHGQRDAVVLFPRSELVDGPERTAGDLDAVGEAGDGGFVRVIVEERVLAQAQERVVPAPVADVLEELAQGAHIADAGELLRVEFGDLALGDEDVAAAELLLHGLDLALELEVVDEEGRRVVDLAFDEAVHDEDLVGLGRGDAGIGDAALADDLEPEERDALLGRDLAARPVPGGVGVGALAERAAQLARARRDRCGPPSGRRGARSGRPRSRRSRPRPWRRGPSPGQSVTSRFLAPV